jgi:RHS repeat-associated protein
VTKLAYDERWGTVVTAIDPNNLVNSASYDGLGLLHQTTDPSGTTTYTYTSTAVADQVVATTAGTIRPRFRVARSKVAGALHEASVTTDVDYRGRVVRSFTDGIGGASIVQEQAYDPTGRLTAATLPHTLPAATIPKVEYRYDGFNRLTQMTRPNGSVVRHEYASAISLRDDRRQWVTGLDCRTALEEGVHGCAAGIEHTVDEAGQPNPIENVIVTDYLGLPIRNVDGENVATADRVTDYSYGGFNLPRGIYGTTLSYFFYDDYGRLTTRRGDNWELQEENRYNGYDELKRTEDAKHEIRLYEYDGLGRLDTIWDSGEVRTKWTYDVGQNGVGRLASSASGITSQDPVGRRIEYAYEPYAGSANRGALQSIKYIIDGVTYPTTVTYDALARPDKITYPNIGTTSPPTGAPIVVQHKYDAASGVLTGLDEVGASATRQLWRVNEAYEGMLLQKETFENGAISTYAYDPQTRFLTYIKTTLPTLPAPGVPSVVNTVQHLVYEPYADGSVHTRTNKRDPAQIIKNEYVYDALHRLASATVTVNGGSPSTKSYGYDIHGNLTSHDGLTNTYSQDNRYKYRLESVGANTYQYDDNGNVTYRAGPNIPGGEQTIEYTPFDLPHTITSGTVDTYIEYTADEQRVALRGPTSTRYFIGGLYERAVDATTTTTTEERFRLYAGGRNLGEIVRRPGEPDQTLFFHTDHLESVDTITTNLHDVSHQDFEPFGANPGNALTRAGFTGHANDTDLGLIDMGGRIYDPLAGRFMTEDPVMQAPYWSQGLNPYSYVFNDPINHTDPSGFSADVDVGGGIVAGFVGIGHAAVPALFAAGFGANFGAAAVGGLASGGMNVGISQLLDPAFGNPFGGTASRSYTVAGATRAATSRSTGPGATQQRAPIGPLTPDSMSLQPREPGLCASTGACVADGGSFSGAGASGTWDPKPPQVDRSVQIAIDALQAVRLAEIAAESAARARRATLSATGRELLDKGMTRAGREYQKHMGRGELPRVPGRDLNSAGQKLLDGILNNPKTKQFPVTSGNFRGGTRFIGPNGIGATFDAKGVFRYFGVYP